MLVVTKDASYVVVFAKVHRTEWVEGSDPFEQAERKREQIIEAEYPKIAEATGESIEDIKARTEIINPQRDPVQWVNFVSASAGVSFWAGEGRWWRPDDVQTPKLADEE